jgi:hypothetical protein
MKLIERIEKQLAKEGLQVRTNAARTWLLNKTKNLRPTPESIMRDRERLKNTTIIGKMYHFFYDPKLKDSLPYYDRFPLVIPIERYPDGFLGLNLHYIHPKQRILLLDKLSEILTNNKYNEATKMKISYDFLAASPSIFQTKACYKKYLFKHIESRFLEIGANEWDIAVMLPTESFIGAPKSKVFRESEDKF